MERISRLGVRAGGHYEQNPQFINGLAEILAGRKVAEKAGQEELPMFEETPSKSGSVTRAWGAGVALSVVLLVAAAGYAFHEHGAAQQLATQNNQITSALQATREQVSALTTKLDA